MTRRTLFQHAAAAIAASILAKLPLAGAKPVDIDNLPDLHIHTRWITKAQLTYFFDRPVPVDPMYTIPAFTPALIGQQLSSIYQCSECGQTLVDSPETRKIVEIGVCPFCNAYA